jgi:membrane-associated phospholipid phosphatase
VDISRRRFSGVTVTTLPRRPAFVIGLLVLLAVGAWLAPEPAVEAWNRHWAVALRPLAVAAPWLNVVWILGGVPVTAAALALGIWRQDSLRRRWRAAVLAAVGGSVVEVLLKHFVPLPVPPAVPAPVSWQRLVAALNLGPSDLTALAHWLFPHGHRVSSQRLLPGSYPSGHVFRSSFVGGLLAPRRRWLAALLVGVPVAFMTVATGGHWAFDTVGGMLLGLAALVAASPE